MKRQLAGVISLALLIYLASGQSVSAQQPPSPFSGKEIHQLQPQGEDKITVARRLISAKDYQAAADLLELVYESEPENGQVQNLLRNCYDHLQQYAKAEILVRRILESQPNSIGHQLYLAETLIKLDNRAEALQTYDKIAREMHQTDPGRRLILINSLIRSGLEDDALRSIDDARRDSGDHGLFATERGGILEKRRDYLPAAREYLQLLATDTSGRAGRAERRLMALLEFDESASVVEPFLVGMADSTGGLATMRLLSDHFLKAGRFDEAFAFVLKQDTLEGGTGFPLVSFMRRCQERRAWSQAARMAEIVLQQYPGRGFEAEVSFEYARALAETDRPREALAVYERLFDRTTDPQTRADALYGSGAVYLNYLDDGPLALSYFDSVAGAYPRGRSYILSRKAAAMCQLREGDLADARRRYAELGASKPPGEVSEEVLFYSGLVDFFDHEYDSARATLRKLTVSHPQGLYVNDALQLVLAIDEAAGSESSLNSFAAANLLMLRGRNDSARVHLLGIADANPPVLGDLALYRLIGLEPKGGNAAVLLQLVDRLVAEHPDSYYQPLGLKLKADILAGTRENVAEAREIYRSLLENHPEYPFVREVREKLRTIDEAEPVG